MKLNLTYLLLAVLFITTACEKTLIGPSKANTDPVANFDAYWASLNEHYGLFEVKQIDWDAAYQANRAKIHRGSTDKELAAALKTLIVPLNDIHTYIIPTNHPELPGRIESSGLFDTLRTQTDYLQPLVESKYVNALKTEGEFMAYGWLANQIGYVHISGMEGSLKSVEKAMNTILGDLQGAKGIVVDIRNNGGGDDRISKYLAGAFAPQTKLFMKTRKRAGKGKNDFSPWQEWYVEPNGSHVFTKPVVLLTSRWSQSAAETFALAMRENDNVTLLGDFTAGGFSDVVAKELPNGWVYLLCIGDYRAADGKSYEGKGVPPDILLVNTKADLANGQDKVLEQAIELLK